MVENAAVSGKFWCSSDKFPSTKKIPHVGGILLGNAKRLFANHDARTVSAIFSQFNRSSLNTK